MTRCPLFRASSVALVAAIAVCLPGPPLAAAPRVWTDRDGRTVEAEFVRADTSAVVIRRVGDGREFTLPRNRLSDADLAFVARASAEAAKPPPGQTSPAPPHRPAESADSEAPPWVAPLNAALDLPLFAETTLWDDSPTGVSERLKLRPESITPGYESWRRFFRRGHPLLGVPAYTLSLRAEEDRVAEVSILFINRGDFPAFAGLDAFSIVPPAALQEFRQRLSADFEKLRGRLAETLPKSEITPSPALRRAFPGELAVFGVGDHQLIVQLLPEWHLALRIQPSERAAPVRLSDDRLRQRLRARVARRETGDVILDRIPMVDQGPKGYCVPATFERLLRYSGIPADMYDLAALGGTGFGGGTNVVKLVESLERTVRQNGRRLEKLELKLTPAGLSRYIDEGRPVLWSLSSTTTFNALASAYSAKRAALSDGSAIKSLAADKRILDIGLRPEAGSAHVCLLVGYNRATGELAFSDSWGPDFAERWLPAAAVQSVSAGECWVLGF